MTISMSEHDPNSRVRENKTPPIRARGRGVSESSRLPPHLRPPRERAGMLARPTLTERVVDAVSSKRLVLITAPSGFGKTTLMADVYRRLGEMAVPHVWLSVTHADRDPVWLARMLIERLGEHHGVPPHDGEDFAAYANRVGGAGTIVVLIDNWNFIESEATNRYFDRLMLETEGLANFVVASRAVPGFLFEIYQMADNYASFGVRDLAFTREEARTFLARSIPPQPIHSLHTLIERTEGWPAGIQLLRLALNQVGEDAAAGIQFSGSRSDVADYLNKTLFSHLPPDRRALLCNLAVLDHVGRELTVEITGEARSAADFAALARDNVFLTETSDGSQRYRFHSLFRDFLLSQHATESTLPQQEILRRAGAWHAARGEIEYAIPYALRSGNGVGAKALLEDYVRRRLAADGKVFLFTEWIGELKKIGETPSPVLEHWYRWSLVFSGRWSVALAFQQTGSSSRETMIDAVIGAFSDDQPALRAAVNRWTADGASGDPFSVAVMRCASAVAEIARGELNSAAKSIHRAKFSVDRTESGFGRAWVLVLSALTTLMRGRAKEAEREIREAIRITDRMTGPYAPIARVTRLTAAVIARHRGADETATSDLTQARLSTDEHGLPMIVVWAEAVARSLGVEWEERSYESKLQSPAVALLAEAYRIEAAMQSGASSDHVENLLEAFDTRLVTAREEDPALLAHGWNLRDLHVSLVARATILRGENEAALRLLVPAIGECQRDGRGLTEQKLGLLRVAALLRQNKRPAALRLLIQTAETAVRCGLLRFFADERRLIEPLLPALFEAGERAPLGNDPVEWTALVTLLGHGSASTTRPVENVDGLDEDLQVTARETEMLAFLDMGLSNREIGDRLGISIPTVKWHLHNLFSKIGVRNRSSAVRYARDNRLI